MTAPKKIELFCDEARQMGALCHADRRHDDSPQSYCRTGRRAIVSSAFPHHGEEDSHATRRRILSIDILWRRHKRHAIRGIEKELASFHGGRLLEEHARAAVRQACLPQS
jgi:hypothetical protein